jgi:hypothetical protein
MQNPKYILLTMADITHSSHPEQSYRFPIWWLLLLCTKVAPTAHECDMIPSIYLIYIDLLVQLIPYISCASLKPALHK